MKCHRNIARFQYIRKSFRGHAEGLGGRMFDTPILHPVLENFYPVLISTRTEFDATLL